MCEALIKSGADVQKIDLTNLYKKFWTSDREQVADATFWHKYLLQWTASRGDVEKSKKLLESGANLNPNDETENLPLYVASQNGHFELSQWMIIKGADINPCIDALLYCYAKNGQIGLCREMFIKGANMNKKIVADQTPWTIMCQSGNLEGVKLFLDRGADPSYPGCLHFAIEHYYTDVAQILIERGCNVNEVRAKSVHISVFISKMKQMNILSKLIFLSIE